MSEFILLFIGFSRDNLYVEIYLVRHGAAENFGPDGRDETRQLTGEGRKKTAKMAEALRERVKDLGIIYHSPLVRAVQTAEIMGQEFAEAPLKEISYLTPYDAPEKVLPLLVESEHYRYVMIVGHQPYMSGLASLLLTGNAEPAIMEFKKSGIAGIEWTKERSQLLFLLSPKFF
ncbi:MAG: phosphohistidine phosphatase SixA [Bdellovibrionota bacterium]